jgi:hypothetical protein
LHFSSMNFTWTVSRVTGHLVFADPHLCDKCVN